MINYSTYCSSYFLFFKLGFFFFFVLLIEVQIDDESYSAGRSNSFLMQATKCTKLEHLKVIKFMGFTCRKDEISLAKCLIQLIKGKVPKINASDGSCLDLEFIQ